LIPVDLFIKDNVDSSPGGLLIKRYLNSLSDKSLFPILLSNSAVSFTAELIGSLNQAYLLSPEVFETCSADPGHIFYTQG
jgi:hypothetical protein